jgi:2-haloalkanoic acid dehalogenase type II
MNRPYDVLTFDCYGTLIDWIAGLHAALERAAAHDGVTVDAATLVHAYHEVEPVVEAETHRSYREVLIESARRAAAAHGWAMSAEAARVVPESLPAWPPFPDTNPALERLTAAGYRLAILSNVDDDLLAGTRRNFTVPFEFTITAEQVRSYKPAAGHFERARARIGAARWLHVAQSWFHDVEPACALGIPVVWINRRREQQTGSARPLWELPDLAALADRLAPSGAGTRTP